jgi:osmotically-inducible protein OsmY
MKRRNTCLAAVGCWALMLLCGSTAWSAAEELDDQGVTIAVESELILKDSVPSHKIDVETDNGIVTLSGSVDSYYAKLAAEDAAESVKGVLAVVNNIEVEPVERLDSRIRGDVVAALAADPVVEAYEITVSVEDGAVTLSGEVDSYAEKTIAESIVDSISGVVDVENQIEYNPVTDREDAEIRQDIRDRLRADASIESGLVTVTVDNGEVTLDGTVSSAVEKTEAEAEAWLVAGVESVTNKIDVQWWRDDETTDWAGGWTDSDMLQAIENALLTNPRVNAFEVNATVRDGVATLTGTVDNMQAKLAAEQEALDTLGVWRVKNYLNVRPAVERTDSEIASDIRDALRRDDYVDRYDITVDVYDSKAYLSGEVDSWYMRQQAEEAAAGVRGLVDIQNNLKVDYEVTAKSDQEIEEDIRSELWWSPFVDADDISVDVQSGVATLMGTVEDWDELQSAKENAREGGATAVISKLQIVNGTDAG